MTTSKNARQIESKLTKATVLLAEALKEIREAEGLIVRNEEDPTIHTPQLGHVYGAIRLADQALIREKFQWSDYASARKRDKL